jgi:hypothetical protein
MQYGNDFCDFQSQSYGSCIFDSLRLDVLNEVLRELFCSCTF